MSKWNSSPEGKSWFKAYQKKYNQRPENKEKARIRARVDYHKNIEESRTKARERARRWLADPVKKAHINKLRVERNERLRLQALDHYGNECVHCGLTDKRFLEFDHIDNDGQNQRKVHGRQSQLYRYLINNKPDDIQILCSNCNKRKRRHNSSWNDVPQRQLLRRHARDSLYKVKAIQHYGGKCNFCGLVDIRFLELDHIHGGGYIDREHIGGGEKFYRWLVRHDYPRELQVLCGHCNRTKSTRKIEKDLSLSV